MPSIFQNGMESLRQIAEALGIDPKKRHITAITIRSSVKECTKITIEEIMDLGQHQGVCTVLKEYQLTHISPDEQCYTIKKQEPPSSVQFREFT